MWKLFCAFILIQMNIDNVFSSVDEQCPATRTTNKAECPRLESYHPWDETNKFCKDYNVKISDTQLPPIALVSMYMSGNLYLLQLVEQSSGLMTGVLYPEPLNSNPRSKVTCGMNLYDGKTILQSNYDIMYDFMPDWYKNSVSLKGGKRDWPTLSTTYFNYRGILLVRNPWLTIIEIRRKIQIGLRACNTCPSRSKTIRQTSDYQGKEFQRFVNFAARQWVGLLRTWINNSPFGSDLVIIKYEDLIRNPEPELRRILKFLNVSIDEGRLKCALADQSYIDTMSTVRDMDVVQEAFEIGHVNHLLEAGINEINALLTSKGVPVKLDYVAPNWNTLIRTEPLWTRKIHPL